MIVNEEIFGDFLNGVEREIKTEFKHIPDTVGRRIIGIIREKAKECFPVGTLPTHGFPMGQMMHNDDYYGLDNEELCKRTLKNKSAGWDGEC